MPLDKINRRQGSDKKILKANSIIQNPSFFCKTFLKNTQKTPNEKELQGLYKKQLTLFAF